MTDLYDHSLHKTYQLRLNNETNIRENIFQALEDFKRLETDLTIYPQDQRSLYDNRFPLANNRIFPDLQISDYVMCINNYRENGNLFTVRYIHPSERYCEALLLDPNDNGQVWLLIISPSLETVEEVKKYSNVNLINDTVTNILF